MGLLAVSNRGLRKLFVVTETEKRSIEEKRGRKKKNLCERMKRAAPSLYTTERQDWFESKGSTVEHQTWASSCGDELSIQRKYLISLTN